MDRPDDPLTAAAADRAVRVSVHPAAVVRPDLTIIAANAAYTALFAGRGREVVGRRCYRVSHGYSRSCHEEGEHCPIQIANADGAPAEVIHQHHTRRGKEMERVVVQPILNESGSISGFLELLYSFETGRKGDERLIGSAPPFRHMINLVERVAPSDVPVLLLGESGTGKELVARMIHERSPRHHHSFVPVDCSGLAETLFESELFGHERGAFTGATHPRKGLVEAATGGTLFLDEIGDIPLPQQVKLLRLLETGLFRRVGSTDQRRSDFRLICATHRDLRRMVQDGQFRRDLYYRINAFPIETPPLRDRVEDVDVLATELLIRIGKDRPPRLSEESLRILERHCFPGNIRELLNILQRATLLQDHGVILPEHLPEELRQDGPTADCRRRALADELVPLDEMEHRYLQWASTSFDGDRRELAEILGISERTLYRKLAAADDDGLAD